MHAEPAKSDAQERTQTSQNNPANIASRLEYDVPMTINLKNEDLPTCKHHVMSVWNFLTTISFVVIFAACKKHRLPQTNQITLKNQTNQFRQPLPCPVPLKIWYLQPLARGALHCLTRLFLCYRILHHAILSLPTPFIRTTLLHPQHHIMYLIQWTLLRMAIP